MKHKYLVIKPNGEVIDPERFMNSNNCSEDFSVLIEREALGKKYPEDKKRESDYLNYANKMGFRWEPNSDLGFIQYDYKAKLIMRLIYDYARQLVQRLDFPVYEVSGSNFFDMSYPVVDAYAGLFGDRLFKFKADKKSLVMSYDSSFPHFNIARRLKLKESQLPFGHFSLSDCYRYEQRGEMMLLFRGRRFHMADLHPYFKDANQAFEYYFNIEKEIVEAAEAVGRKYVRLAKVSNLENWKNYNKQIIEIAKSNEEPVLVEIRMDGQDRYWIIDVDYSIIDQYRQPREIGCIQIDAGNAERLGISYKDSAGNYHNPFIIHSAIPGGVERFLYMLFDNFKNFPIWLHPVQLRFIPVGEKYINYCEKLAQKYSNIRVEIDDRAEGVSKRIKRAHEDLVPFQKVIGEKEAKGSGMMNLESEMVELQDKSIGYPCIPIFWPIKLSEQVC